MFANNYQPSVISLFSSTGSRPLDLFSKHVDKALPSDSVIHFLNDTTSTPAASPPATLVQPPPINADSDPEDEGQRLCQTVLHIQSPTLPTTYIRCPPAGWRSAPAPAHARTAAGGLGLTHAWVHLQVRGLGREWAFEVGVVDQAGKAGAVRCSTFQKQPALKASTRATPPLLLLPLSFPPPSSRPLTAWATVSLDLASLMPQFILLAPSDTEDDTRYKAPLPSSQYSHVSYLKVYPNCRLRRIWFSENRLITQPWEFQLYASG